MNTWYKLKDGTWGVKIRHQGTEGEAIEVTNKAGEVKDAILGKRVAKFDDAELWSLFKDEPAEPAF
jgi:hypothetical protein